MQYGKRVVMALCVVLLGGCPGGGSGGSSGDSGGKSGEGGTSAGTASRWGSGLGSGGAGEGGSTASGGSAGASGSGASTCSDTCSDANDGYCDDGGPNADYGLCALGTDCGDCGPRGDSTFVPEPEDDSSLYSTLCYEVTSSGVSENLELNCTPDASMDCDIFGLQATEYVYSSRSVCLADGRNVLAHWQQTGNVAGASPDVNTNAGSGGTAGGGSGGVGGESICLGGRSTLTLRAVEGCWFERASRPQQACGVYDDGNWYATSLCPSDERVMHVNGSDTIHYEYCYVSEVGSDYLTQWANCWDSSAHIISGTFDPDAPDTSLVVELSPNGGSISNGGAGGNGGLNEGCGRDGDPCVEGTCCPGQICFNGACELF
jgi:hypothetical protein